MKLVVVNRASCVSDADIRRMTDACRIQMVEHAAPSLGRLPWEIVAVGSLEDAPTDAYPIVVIDDPDMAGALGYHSSDQGVAWGRVFVRAVLDQPDGSVVTGATSVSCVLSHEILETFCDRGVNVWADRGDGTMVAWEVCDPVEGDAYAIELDGHGVFVSNFVLEPFFDSQASGRFDYLNRLSAPFTMTSGGYMIVRDKAGNTSEVYASSAGRMAKAAKKPHRDGSRSARRLGR